MEQEKLTQEIPEDMKQEVALNPADVLYEVDVHMTASVLYDYMLRHTYMSLTGPIATLLGIMCIMFFVNNGNLIYLFAGIVIILYLPWTLFLNAKRQALTNEAFKKPLHYSFTKDGIYVSQDDRVEMQRWENMLKAVSTGKSVIVYTSKVNASVFPRKDLGNDVPVLLEILCRYMDPKKVKFKQ